MGGYFGLESVGTLAGIGSLKERGKPEKVARIAAARKLLLIAHAIYKSGDKYREPGGLRG